MPFKAQPREHVEAIIYPHVDNVDTRSAYGDNHAATEDAMMDAHSKTLHAAGIISEEMEKPLSKVRPKGSDYKVVYTADYLAALPTYVGANVDDMPSYEVALRRQKEKDALEEKWLADFAAGRIDANGRPVCKEMASSKGVKVGICTQVIQGEEEDEHTGDTTISAYVSSDDSAYCPSPSKDTSRTASPRETSAKVVQRPKESATIPTAPSAAQPLITSNSTSPAAPKTSLKPKRIRHAGPPVTPLTPLPKYSTYEAYDYYALAALCRERQLLSGGSAPALRNRLIQDDTNMAQGKKREMKAYKGPSRRVYKHGVPTSSEDSSRTASRSTREEGLMDVGNLVGRGVGLKRLREESDGTGNSEEALEVLDRAGGEGTEGARKRAKLKVTE